MIIAMRKIIVYIELVWYNKFKTNYDSVLGVKWDFSNHIIEYCCSYQ